ncbi:hypothetical protein ACFYU8_17900 [Brevibacillus sp. NPDC003359]|uniref:hypothetical protein n=1 Tax=unclassified Brevibacillus TaxID=2684853 RepID=UPI00368FCA77
MQTNHILASEKSLVIGTYYRKIANQQFAIYRSLFIRTNGNSYSAYKNIKILVSAVEVGEEIRQQCERVGFYITEASYPLDDPNQEVEHLCMSSLEGPVKFH